METTTAVRTKPARIPSASLMQALVQEVLDQERKIEKLESRNRMLQKALFDCVHKMDKYTDAGVRAFINGYVLLDLIESEGGNDVHQ